MENEIDRCSVLPIELQLQILGFFVLKYYAKTTLRIRRKAPIFKSCSIGDEPCYKPTYLDAKKSYFKDTSVWLPRTEDVCLQGNIELQLQEAELICN